MCLVASMVFIGGVTRLTESGLSIVEWKLFSGVLPPMTENEWQKEFAEYQTSPEYKIKNSDFTVDAFKRIYWLEYIHRLLGRFIGLAVIVPFLFFSVCRKFSPSIFKRTLCACFLVSAQGTVGWIMVKSGLMDAPRVHPMKLTLHLSLALSLFALLLSTYWKAIARSAGVAVTTTFRGIISITTLVLIIQIILGAFVAGNDAGLSYNTYPLMDGRIIPAGLSEALSNGNSWMTNTLIVQFAHRAGAHVLIILCAIILWIGLRSPHTSIRRASVYLALSIIVQFILGVLTLIHGVPIALASAHQMTAIVLLITLMNLRHLTSKPQ
jgi:cytochrome c oxidase assembly protein subunit 15